MSWWVCEPGEPREAFWVRWRANKSRIEALGINPTAADMARMRKTRKQREQDEEV